MRMPVMVHLAACQLLGGRHAAIQLTAANVLELNRRVANEKVVAEHMMKFRQNTRAL
jgi:hypothetical protein